MEDNDFILTKDGELLDEFLDLLKLLVRTPSVVGMEYPFFRSVKRELEDIGVKVIQYEGVLVATGNDPKRGYVSAHIDRHGLMCTGPNEFQYAAYISQNRGDLSGKSLSEQTYMTISERFREQNVMAYEPWSGSYLGRGTITNSYVCERRLNMVFEVKGLEHLTPGTPVAFVDKLSYKDGFLSAQLDNVVNAAIIIFLYRLGYQGTAFFTAQEESGRSWRFLLEWFRRVDVKTNKLLVLDTSPFADREAACRQQIIFRNKDVNSDFDVNFVKYLKKSADSLGIAYDFKDEIIELLNKEREKDKLTPQSIGITELGRVIVASKNEITGASIQIPTTGYHTTNETSSIDSVLAMTNLLKKILV